MIRDVNFTETNEVIEVKLQQLFSELLPKDK